MNAENNVDIMEATTEPAVSGLDDDNIEETGSLLLTADSFEEPVLLPRFQVNTSKKTQVVIRKKASNNSASSPATKKISISTVDRSTGRRNASTDPPERVKNKKAAKSEAESKNGITKRARECAQCGKSYLQTSSLVTHMRLHTGERPFECKVCEKKFVQSGHLTSHMRHHTGERPHACSVCDKRFGAANDLRVTVTPYWLSRTL